MKTRILNKYAFFVEMNLMGEFVDYLMNKHIPLRHLLGPTVSLILLLAAKSHSILVIRNTMRSMAELLIIRKDVIIPTFKIGDIVWVYDFMWGILPCEVDRPYHCRCGKEGGCTFEMNFSEADIGDLVFATKEEAEIYWHEKGRKK